MDHIPAIYTIKSSRNLTKVFDGIWQHWKRLNGNSSLVSDLASPIRSVPVGSKLLISLMIRRKLETVEGKGGEGGEENDVKVGGNDRQRRGEGE